MVQQSSELLLPIFLRCFAHTLQPLGLAFPAPGPARVRLPRVLLGQLPSLHNLRRRCLALVRLLRWYYPAVRLPTAVHEGLTAHRVHLPARVTAAGGSGVSRFSRMEFLCMLGGFDSAGTLQPRNGAGAGGLPSWRP